MPLGDSSRAVEFHFLTECNHFLPLLPFLERHGQIGIERGMKSEKKVSQTVNKTNMTEWSPHKSNSAHDLPYGVLANAFHFLSRSNNWTVCRRTFAVYLHSVLHFNPVYAALWITIAFITIPTISRDDFFHKIFFLTTFRVLLRRSSVREVNETFNPSYWFQANITRRWWLFILFYAVSDVQ